ncbi:tetratricopeptide repeat protein [Massilia orientalis]|uniref:Tetratricopeptide repeat protein n=1 Tax=Massilia orientalis TaxID=3050128 RepID=A0ACC7MKC4_9BURK|nr:tetratricopeptide repeat protein [Massilia sp. YIM B02787]
MRLIVAISIFLLAALCATNANARSCSREDNGPLDFCLQLAQAGNAVAALNLGEMYRDGAGVAQDATKARYWFEQSARAGLPAAQHNLALLFYFGSGGPVDKDQAFYWMKMAALSGSATSQKQLGAMYLNGWGTPVDVEAGLRLIRAAADQGFQVDFYLSQLRQYATPSRLETLKAYGTNWAIRGNVGAMRELGRTNLYLTHDFSAAFHWLKKAADRKDPYALFDLANMYFFGKAFKRNWATAAEYLQQAWDAGSIQAGFQLAELDILLGKGISHPDEVRHVLEAAWEKAKPLCKEGTCDFDGFRLLAIAYERKYGGPQDLDKTREIYSIVDKLKMDGTDSYYSENDPWEKRMPLKYARPSVITDIPAQTQLELGLKKVKELTPNFSKSGTKAVLDFDMQVYVDASSQWTPETVGQQIEFAAKILAQCNIRLRKARIWLTEHYSNENQKDFRSASGAAISAFFVSQKDTKKPNANRDENRIEFPWVRDVDLPIEQGQRGILPHELGHMFSLPHPANWERTVMQYGWLGNGADQFTAIECEQMRQHELLTKTKSDAKLH